MPSGLVMVLALKMFPLESVQAAWVGARTSTPRCWARRLAKLLEEASQPIRRMGVR